MIKFCKDGRVFFDGQQVLLSEINAEDFFVANLSMPIELEEGIRMEIIMTNFSYLREFIFQFFSDYYDKLKPLIESKDINGRYSKIKIFNKMIIENGYMNLQPSVDFIQSEQGEMYRFLGQIPVFISEDVVVIEQEEGMFLKGEIKCQVTLQGLLEAIFEDLTYSLTEGFIE